MTTTTLPQTQFATLANPDVLHSRKYLDFGQGFYVTPTKMQAVNYAQRIPSGWNVVNK